MTTSAPERPREAANQGLDASWHLLTTPEKLTRGERLGRLLDSIPDGDAPQLFDFEGRPCLAFPDGDYELELARAGGKAPATGRWKSGHRGSRGSVAIVVPRTAALNPDVPGGIPGGAQAVYTHSYGTAFWTEGTWGHWTEEDGGEYLQVGDLRVILRKPEPPAPVEPDPYQFDATVMPTPFRIDPDLATGFSASASAARRGSGRHLEALLRLYLDLEAAGLDPEAVLAAALDVDVDPMDEYLEAPAMGGDDDSD